MDATAPLIVQPSPLRGRLRVQRPTQVTACLLAAIIVLTVWAVMQTPLRAEAGDHWLQPIQLTTLPFLIACLCRGRGWQRCSLFFGSLGWVFAASSVTILAMYLTALSGRPLADPWLVRVDAWLAFSAPALVEWIGRHPRVGDVLSWMYNFIFMETLLVLAVLSIFKDKEALEGFVLQFMLSISIVLAIFYLYPAVGPFVTYGYDPTPAQQDYLTQFTALRTGELGNLDDPKGLVTFPSFHTAWALLLAYALRRHALFFSVGVVANAMIVLSTLTTGWHYLTDVLGGVLVTIIAILIAQRVCHTHRERSDAVRRHGAPISPPTGGVL
ncbi:MAG: phosphatase PAP2 family protein [Actinomycetota bacterium]|nr:phosphatase PAP2 family protein [Actinomycetota bacterium]